MPSGRPAPTAWSAPTTGPAWRIRRRLGRDGRNPADPSPLREGNRAALAKAAEIGHPATATPGVLMWRREQRSLGAELVTDCEAFLLGHYADRLEAQSIAVPVWAWTNLLAHATEHELRAETFATGGAGRRGDQWHTARAQLAVEVLDTAGRVGTLVALQVTTIVPLELSLASREDAAAWSCREWVDAVRAALSQPRSPHA